MINVDWIGFILASVAVVLAPGPGSLFVAKTAATRGPRAGFVAMFGLMLSDTCLIVLSMLGLSALFLAYPSLFSAVRLAGAGYLVFLGIQALLAKPENRSDFDQGNILPFRRAVAITLLNPKAVFFFMAFFPVFIGASEHGLIAAYTAMTLAFMTISATYLSLLVLTSSKLALAFQRNPTLQWVTGKLCGCVFIGFGLKVAAASK
jgi:leucine efflux protein